MTRAFLCAVAASACIAHAAAAEWLAGAQAEAWLGFSVAGAGDIDGDGVPDALVGALLEDATHGDAGSAWLLRGAPNGASAPQPVAIHGDQVGAAAGHFVSAAGDVDGDSIDDFVVGAGNFDLAADDEGVAFVFHGAPGFAATSLADASGRVAIGEAFAGLGFGDARAGDVDADGFDDLLLGSPHFGAGGAAFVVRGSTSGVGFRTSAAADARILSDVADSEFGAAFAPAGDVNGDGFDDVVVGAPEEGLGGAAYVFHGGAQGIVAASQMQASTRLVTATPGARFGYSVAAGDWNGDGFDDVAIGAPLGGAAQGGMVQLYFGTAQGIADTAVPLTIESDAFGDRLGSSVALVRNRGGDGTDALLAGAPGRSDALPSAGAVLTVAGSRTGIVVREWNPGDRAFAQLGFAVADAGNRGWIAGAPFRSDDDDAQGGALLAAPEPSAWLAALGALGALGALSAVRGTSRACAAASGDGSRDAARPRTRCRRHP
jgi:hypothetical protein